jgi:pathogenesis-related protein 1
MKGLVAAALLVLAACSGDIDSSSTSDANGSGSNHVYMDAPASTGEPANLAGMTNAHNAVRMAVDTSGIAGGPLPLMKWDPALATLAMNWTSQCIDTDGDGLVDHSSQASRTNAAGYAYVGENVYASSGSATAQGAVSSWAAEKASFTYPNTCAGTCGHYTQIVWRTSVNVGCALVTCPSLQYKSTILCNYGPGGNSGGAPY